MVYLTLVYHHGGNLVTKDNGSVVYEGDNIDVQDPLDEDTLDVFAVRDHHHALGYPKILDVRWLEPGREIATGLRTIVTDRDLLEMCRLARENNNKVHICYEHVVSEPQVEEDVPQLIEMAPNSAIVEEVMLHNKQEDLISCLLKEECLQWTQCKEQVLGQHHGCKPFTK
ncbi:hypothetical protein PIB30_074587 [Stylosanthes scabra]|uniref:PB1-like domain-containing protein n=1 Tax=Stylosanthes scabra TaxID=79078 RepID=A0ABU6YQ17_9FABA|nr:hypothetical protein [Stylosanthes scabra]